MSRDPIKVGMRTSFLTAENQNWSLALKDYFQPIFTGYQHPILDAIFSTKYEMAPVEHMTTYPTKAAMDSIIEAVTTTDGTSIKVAHVEYLEYGDVITFFGENGTPGEKCIVQAINPSTGYVTVERGSYASTAATHLINTRFFIHPPSRLEGSVRTDFTTTTPNMLPVYAQNFGQTIEVTDSKTTREVTLETFFPDIFVYKYPDIMKLKVAELKNKVENQALFEDAYVGTNAIPARMGGFIPFITTNVIDTDNAITQGDIDDLIESIDGQHGDTSKLFILTSNKVWKTISRNWGDQRFQTRTDPVAGHIIKSWMAYNGSMLDIVVKKRIPDDTFIVMNTEAIKLGMVKGEEMKLYAEAPNHAHDRHIFVYRGTFNLRVENENRLLGKIVGGWGGNVNPDPEAE